MNTYLIIAEDPEGTGVLLGKKNTLNPESAMHEVARDVVDDDFLQKMDPKAESVVEVALWILDYAILEEDEEIFIYRASIDEHGKTEMITPEDLEFASHD